MRGHSFASTMLDWAMQSVERFNPLSFNEAVMAMQTAASPQDVFHALLGATARDLETAAVFTVQGSELSRTLSFEDDRLVDAIPGEEKFDVAASSVVNRACQDNVLYIGPIPATDPCVHQLYGQVTERPFVVLPVSLANQVAYVLIGVFRSDPSPRSRNTLSHIAHETSLALTGIKVIDPAKSNVSSVSSPPIVILTKKKHRPDPSQSSVVVRQEPQRETEPKAESPRAEHSSSSEQREHYRFPLTVEVDHLSDHNFFAGFMEDVSEGGLFVATHAHIPVGQVVELTFTVPGLDEDCKLLCKVRWVREYDPTNHELIPGIGVSFIDLPDRVKLAIHSFFKKREPIFYDD